LAGEQLAALPGDFDLRRGDEVDDADRAGIAEEP
jgi:hypothetical protein